MIADKADASLPLPVDKQYAHSFLSLWEFFALIFQLIPS